MSSASTPSPSEEREELVARRKAEIWLIAIVMTTSFCVVTTIVFLIIWLLLK